MVGLFLEQPSLPQFFNVFGGDKILFLVGVQPAAVDFWFLTLISLNIQGYLALLTVAYYFEGSLDQGLEKLSLNDVLSFVAQL